MKGFFGKISSGQLESLIVLIWINFQENIFHRCLGGCLFAENDQFWSKACWIVYFLAAVFILNSCSNLFTSFWRTRQEGHPNSHCFFFIFCVLVENSFLMMNFRSLLCVLVFLFFLVHEVKIIFAHENLSKVLNTLQMLSDQNLLSS